MLVTGPPAWSQASPKAILLLIEALRNPSDIALIDSEIEFGILLEMGEAVVKSTHYNALFCLGLVPFILVLIMSILSSRLITKSKGRFA